MSKNKSKHHPDGLKSKVFKAQTHTDEKGLFIFFCNALNVLSEQENGRIYVPVCEYKFHRGIVEDLDVCNTRHCTQLRRIRPTKDPYCASLYRVYTRKNKSRTLLQALK